jgi:transposase-like protein
LARRGYRSGYHGRTLITRAGELEQRVPQDRHAGSRAVRRYQRSEHALLTALAAKILDTTPF